MDERPEQTIPLAKVTRGMGNLYAAYQFGESAARPGLTDTAHTAAHHIGGMLEQLRILRDAQVEELRAQNRGAV